MRVKLFEVVIILLSFELTITRWVKPSAFIINRKDFHTVNDKSDYNIRNVCDDCVFVIPQVKSISFIDINVYSLNVQVLSKDCGLEVSVYEHFDDESPIINDIYEGTRLEEGWNVLTLPIYKTVAYITFLQLKGQNYILIDSIRIVPVNDEYQIHRSANIDIRNRNQKNIISVDNQNSKDYNNDNNTSSKNTERLYDDSRNNGTTRIIRESVTTVETDTTGNKTLSTFEKRKVNILENILVKIKDNLENTEENSGESGKNSEETDENTGEADENIGETGENTREIDENTRETDENTRETDINTGKTNENTRETDVNTRETDENTRETDENTGETDENTGKTNENTGKTNENTRETDENTRETDENTGETDENIRETDENTGKTDENTRETDENTVETDENTGITNENTRETKNMPNENDYTLIIIIVSVVAGVIFLGVISIGAYYLGKRKAGDKHDTINVEDIEPPVTVVIPRVKGVFNFDSASVTK